MLITFLVKLGNTTEAEFRDKNVAKGKRIKSFINLTIQQDLWHTLSIPTRAAKSQKAAGNAINLMKKIIMHYPFKIGSTGSALPLTALAFLQFQSVR